MTRSFLRMMVPLGMCVLFAHPLSACQDTDQGSITAVASETPGAVALSSGLPTVPELVEAQGIEMEGQAEVSAWWDSWRLPDSDGALIREGLYPTLSARLFPLLTRKGVAELLIQNEESLRTAKGVGVVLENAEIELALESALRLHSMAWTALEDGDGEGALGLALHSADALRAVSSQQVASELLSRAQESLRRNDESLTYSLEELTRIRRLTNGAKEALADGDYPRAIRRAYYACQLLGDALG
jgi:hypothetical protein